MTQGVNWDDLKVFLAVARAGSLAQATKTLGVTHATVSRRISALEDQLGTRLFDRLPSGHTLTPLGRSVEEIVARIETEVNTFQRLVEGKDKRLEGHIVLSAPEVTVLTWLGPFLEEFTEAYPDISLELLTTDDIRNLHQREADVAVRFINEPSRDLVGRRVTRVAGAEYVSRSYLEAHPPDDPAQRHRWIGWCNRSGEDEWLRGPHEDAPVFHRVNSTLGAIDAAKRGFGIARLPCYIADEERELVRITDAYFERWIWLLTHEDLRNSARIKTFTDFLYGRMRATRGRVESDATEWRIPPRDAPLE